MGDSAGKDSQRAICRLRRRLGRAVRRNSPADIDSLLLSVSISVANDASTLADGSSYLHVACREGHAEVAVQLIQHGVNVNSLDVELNTALHYAVKRLESHRSSKSWQAVSKIILAILRADPSSYEYENGTGMSPRHILESVLYQKRHKASVSSSHNQFDRMQQFLEDLESILGQQRDGSYDTADDDWHGKVTHALLEEVDELDGSEWRFFEGGYQFETLDSYMTRLGQAMDRHMFSRHQMKFSGDKAANGHAVPEEPAPKRCLGPLKPEVLPKSDPQHLVDHDTAFLQLLARVKRKEMLSESDVPWPCHGSAEDMACELVKDIKTDQLRPHILRLLRRWHPDKFAQHVASALKESHRQCVLTRVTALSQALMTLLPTS